MEEHIRFPDSEQRLTGRQPACHLADVAMILDMWKFISLSKCRRINACNL
jgi:hypothetical protein